MTNSPHAAALIDRGKAVAALLGGSWRVPCPEPHISDDELTAIAPLLLLSGAAGLAWRRIAHSHLVDCPAAHELRAAYRLQTLQAALHARTIVSATATLSAAGIQPVLVKGWAIARLYPEEGLRPYGDIDLCVPPEQYVRAQAALPAELAGRVDLHNGFAVFDRRRSGDMFARASTVTFRDSEVRILSAEDHLRLLCFHLLRHGAWRPLWLCDVALAVESRPENFDWDDCLGSVRRESDWIACTIGLSHQLLGARVDDTPVATRARRLPGWLVPTVLRQWGTPPRLRVRLTRYLGDPVTLLREIPGHLANPLQATINLRGPLNNVPRLPFQIADTFMRAAMFCAQVLEQVKARK